MVSLPLLRRDFMPESEFGWTGEIQPVGIVPVDYAVNDSLAAQGGLRNPCLNASTRWAAAAWVPGGGNSIFGILGACCASTGGPVAATTARETAMTSALEFIGRR